VMTRSRARCSSDTVHLATERAVAVQASQRPLRRRAGMSRAEKTCCLRHPLAP
jgi:hypothetical protein